MKGTVGSTRLPPDGALLLDWVFGYSGGATGRNNAKLNAEGSLVYYVAAVGVVHEFRSSCRSQAFFTGHSDDITSLALNSEGRIAATGQMGRDAYIALWNAVTCAPLSVLHDAHDFAVRALAFSSDTKFLASVGGLDQEPILVVWDWGKGRQIARHSASSYKVEEVEFHPDNSLSLATCGQKHASFWRLRGNVLDCQNGLFLGAKKEDQLSVTFFGKERAVSGSEGGHLVVWLDGKVEKVVRDVHPGGVSVTCCFEGGLMSGGVDGTIKVFDDKLNLVAKIPEVASLVYGKAGSIQSLASSGDTIIVGTQQNEIWLMKWTKKEAVPVECLVQGHGQGEVWALATHPAMPIAVTGSDDKTLRLWSLSEFLPSRTRVLEDSIRSVAFSADGDTVAAGLLHGALVVCHARTLGEVFRVRDRKEARHDVRFSPDDKLLAVASNDNFVDIYTAGPKYAHVRTLSGLSSFVTHLDWSIDSNFIQVNSGAGERLIFRVNGTPSPTGSPLIVDALPPSVSWASWTCVLGDTVSGLWAKYSDINDINAVDANLRHGVVVSGDDFGLVKLFRFPCPKRGSKPRSSVGHSAHVTNVRWTFDQKGVVSLGGADHAVFLWKFRPARAMTSLTETVRPKRVDDDSDEDVLDTEDELEAIPELTGSVDEELSNLKAGRKSRRSRPLSSGIGGGMSSASSPSGRATTRRARDVRLCGDSVFAKRCQAADEAPTDNEPPGHSLAIQHVFGFRSYDCRNNCHWLSDQRVVYNVAAIAVICNPETGVQTHYLHHTDDILCLTVHPDGELVATGEIGHNPSVHVWSSSSMKILSYLGGGHERGVSAVAFSGDGERLVSIGMDDHHSICVWKWVKGQKIASVRNYTKKVFGACFSPSTSTQLLTFGVRHIRVWTVVGSGMAWRKIKMGPKFKTDTALSCAVLSAESGDKWAVGLASGNVLVVSQVGIERAIKAHNGAVYSIFTSDKESNLVWTGGRNGIICEWSQQFEKCLKSYPISDHSLDVDSAVCLVSSLSHIRALSWHKGASKPLLIGTQNSEVLLMSAAGNVSIVEQGHCKGEIWGVSVHPRLPSEMVTVSEDRTLRRWSIGDAFQAIALVNLRKAARCVHFHPKGIEIAVGFYDGSVSLFAYPSLERIGGAHHREEKIADVKFSPDGRILAVASHDSFVDLYVVDTDGDSVSKESQGLKRLGVCRDASSFISHVTWHKDSRLLQINSGAGEQLFYEAPKGTRLLIPSKSESLLAWDPPLTCPLDVTLAGVWQLGNDLSDLNAVATARGLPLVVTASDERGLLKLFKYPAPGSLKRYRRYGAHSSHVTKVLWTLDDKFVITCGGADTSVIVWKVRDEAYFEDMDRDLKALQLQPLQTPDLPEEEVTSMDCEISGLSDVSSLPPLIDSRRLTFDAISKEERQDSGQFLVAVQKMRAMPTLRGDSKVFVLAQDHIKSIELDEGGEIIDVKPIHTEHTSPVSAITISGTEPRMVASAEMVVALIHIWHPQDGAIITKLELGKNTKIVTCLSFCRNGRYIAVLSDASVVHVMNWVKAKHISKAELKTGGVVAIKFTSETTVAALTPKALFLCDLVGNALLPTRTLVPPGILPDLTVVFTSLTVDNKDQVFVGCSDTSVIEWSARVAVGRANKNEGKNSKDRSNNSKQTEIPTGIRLIIAATEEFVYTTHRHKTDVILQVFSTKDLTFVSEHRTPAPSGLWNPSSLSVGESTLVIGATKSEPILLFDTSKQEFKLLQTDLVTVHETGKSLDRETNTVKKGDEERGGLGKEESDGKSGKGKEESNGKERGRTGKEEGSGKERGRTSKEESSGKERGRTGKEESSGKERGRTGKEESNGKEERRGKMVSIKDKSQNVLVNKDNETVNHKKDEVKEDEKTSYNKDKKMEIKTEKEVDKKNEKLSEEQENNGTKKVIETKDETIEDKKTADAKQNEEDEAKIKKEAKTKSRKDSWFRKWL